MYLAEELYFTGGNLMMGLDEETIMSTFNVTDPLHRKALLNSINRLKEKGVKPASNLWEFKVCNKLLLLLQLSLCTGDRSFDN